MAKNVVNVVKLQIQAGKATPAPPVGPALGQAGINIAEFTKNFNAQTQDQAGSLIPVVITVYEDRSFDFVTKQPPMSDLLRKIAKVQKGSGQPNEIKVADITTDQVREIAEKKMPDLNAASIEAAMEIVKGTARSMGFLIDGQSLDAGEAKVASAAEIKAAAAEAVAAAEEAAEEAAAPAAENGVAAEAAPAEEEGDA